MGKRIARPPVVVILGHVDHGKTTLLDYIRKSRLTMREVGGITQKIGAYEIETGIKNYPVSKITFIDTPGHEAFSKLRARGAKVADIAILIIDAQDSLKPQTLESISHIQAAKIPFIVALNKIDLPNANPRQVETDLAKHNIITESKGGEIVTLPISAKTGQGVDNLLETILLVAGEKEFSYSLPSKSLAYIIETKKDRRGIVATAIVKEGSLAVGKTVYANELQFKIKNLTNDLGKPVKEAFPSTPVEVLGFKEMPPVGAIISSEPVKLPSKTQEIKKPSTENVKELMVQEEEKKEKKLKLIIKADSQGSLESVVESLINRPRIEIVLQGVGKISKSDLFLAKTTGAIIVGFSIKTDNKIEKLAKEERVVIKTYHLIYELLEELIEVSDLLEEKEERIKSIKGTAKILATFTIDGEKIYGVKIFKGKINIGDKIRVLRNKQVVDETKLVSLKTRAKKITEVKKDQEAGMIFQPLIDIKVGDMIESIL